MKIGKRPEWCANAKPEGELCYIHATKRYCTSITRCKFFMKEKAKEEVLTAYENPTKSKEIG